LGDVTVHDFDVLLNFVTQNETVGVSLGLSENNSLAKASVANKHVSKSRKTVLEGAADSQVLHFAGCFVFQVLSQIDYSAGRFHVLVGNLTDPAGDSG
jgi:hypothetical protein